MKLLPHPSLMALAIACLLGASYLSKGASPRDSSIVGLEDASRISEIAIATMRATVGPNASAQEFVTRDNVSEPNQAFMSWSYRDQRGVLGFRKIGGRWWQAFVAYPRLHPGSWRVVLPYIGRSYDTSWTPTSRDLEGAGYSKDFASSVAAQNPLLRHREISDIAHSDYTRNPLRLGARQTQFKYSINRDGFYILADGHANAIASDSTISLAAYPGASGPWKPPHPAIFNVELAVFNASGLDAILSRLGLKVYVPFVIKKRERLLAYVYSSTGLADDARLVGKPLGPFPVEVSNGEVSISLTDARCPESGSLRIIFVVSTMTNSIGKIVSIKETQRKAVDH